VHNYDAVMQSMRMLADEQGLAVSPRRVTLSTVGIVPAMERLAAEPVMPNLAISLHATTNATRDRIAPVNRKYPLEQLLEACRRFPLKRRNRITFEYVLLEGVNDTPEDAHRLARLLGDIKAKVNLLPLNAAPGIPYERPSDERVNAFAQILADHHVTVSVRRSRGRDIRAACGQLIVEGQKKSAGRKLAALME
jgi:23S rRNA (adenine2503-C2)-methyltransferase